MMRMVVRWKANNERMSPVCETQSARSHREEPDTRCPAGARLIYLSLLPLPRSTEPLDSPCSRWIGSFCLPIGVAA